MLSQLDSRKKSLEIFPPRVRPERSGPPGVSCPRRGPDRDRHEPGRADWRVPSRAGAVVVNPATSNSLACLDGSYVNKAGCWVWAVLLPTSGDILPHGHLPP